ncbi:MAG: hypothetical protein AAGL98_13850 [Planctomycetota bacterium]
MPDIYSIDGSDVNDRIEWRHELPQTELTASRLEAFPGHGGQFALVGEAKGVVLTISGSLEASSIRGLHDEVLDAYQIRDQAGLHTVRIHGIAYQNMLLVAFGPTAPLVGFRHTSGDDWVKVPVRYRWQQLIPGGGS